MIFATLQHGHTTVWKLRKLRIKKKTNKHKTILKDIIVFKQAS